MLVKAAFITIEGRIALQQTVRIQLGVLRGNANLPVAGLEGKNAMKILQFGFFQKLETAFPMLSQT